MKLWLVIYFFGEVAGSVGPLPYDTEEQGMRDCTSFSETVQAAARKEHAGASVVTADGRTLTHDDMKAICEWHADRPITAPQWLE